jgi:hypothetical protein
MSIQLWQQQSTQASIQFKTQQSKQVTWLSSKLVGKSKVFRVTNIKQAPGN